MPYHSADERDGREPGAVVVCAGPPCKTSSCDALAVLDQHEVTAATVLGHSWGGYLAMQLAAREPSRVNALVLADPVSKEDKEAVALESFRMDWPGYFADPAQAPPVPDTVRVNPEAHEQTSASLAEAVARGDLPGMLSRFSGPVEVIAGECSPLPREAAESTAAVFPDARLTIVPGAGHQLWHEAPGTMAAAPHRVAARLT